MAIDTIKRTIRNRRRRSPSTLGEFIGVIFILLLGVAVLLGIIYGWAMLIAWSLNLIFDLAIPYTWQTAVAITVVNASVGAIFSRAKPSKS